MRSLIFHRTILVVALVLFRGIASTGGGPELPDADGSAVWGYLREINYQEGWELWPGKGELYEGGEPHGALFTTYLNPAAFEALTGKAGSLPNGAMIVKENYASDGTFDLITITYNVNGYNPDHNDRDGALRDFGRGPVSYAVGE